MTLSIGKTVFRHPIFPVIAVSCLAVLILGVGCGPSTTSSTNPDSAEGATGPPWFEDVTEDVGLDFVHDPGPVGTYFTPPSMSGGCAFFDFDGDGLIDIYLLHCGGPDGKKSQLFRQLPGGTFKDVSAGSGLDIAGHCIGVAIGDVNNDGLPDVLVTQYGAIKLFLNRGNGHFEDVTEAAGLVNPLWGTSAAFVDYDRDGWLDLVVVNYLDYDPKKDCPSPKGVKDFCGPTVSGLTCSKLYHNRSAALQEAGTPADRVRFEDVSFASGIGQLAGPGLGVVCADFDGDGWPDIFISNDGQPNRLWINQKNGTFKDEAVSRNLAFTEMGKAYAGMGVAIGDVSGSGMFDLYVTHLGSETHTLWRQGPRGLFHDRTFASGLATSPRHGTGFGTLMADFDLDGFPDLGLVNGRVFRGSSAKAPELGFWEPYAERNELFANDGTGKFRDISTSNPAFCGYWNVGRGLACADFNNDGAPDLLVTSVGGRARLFRNVAPNRGHWLKVRAIDPKLKRDAYGAEVRVQVGERVWLRLINPASSYLSSSEPTALFGLGKATAIDSIHVTWPDGAAEVFSGGAVDRSVEVRKGEGHAP